MDYSLLFEVVKKDPEHTNSTLSQIQMTSQFYDKDYEVYYNLGIIDTLTYYDIKKFGEKIFNKLIFQKNQSCVAPDQYRQRFIDFLRQNFLEK